MSALPLFYGLYSVYQPLVALDTEQFIGHEALIRSPAYESPEQLFCAARSNGRLCELDLAAASEAIRSYPCPSTTSGSQPLLFMNLFPSTLINPAFPLFLEEQLLHRHLTAKQLVLEINEASEEEKMWDISLLGESIQAIRRHGILIALDDVGSGAASLKKMIQYEPDIIKLDRFFGENLAASPAKQKLVSLFVAYCRDQCKLVLEGIEREDDLAAARMLGVPYGQGFLLGRPARLHHNQRRQTPS